MRPIRPTRSVPRALAALLAALGCAVLALALTAGPASATPAASLPAGPASGRPAGELADGAAAQTSVPAPATTGLESDGSSPIPRIIPLPNSGQAPQDPGDRGGWLQVSLFWFLLGALGLIGLLIWRDGHRKKRKAAAARAARAAAAGAPAPAGTGGRTEAP